MRYRCEAASVEGFVQQLACNLVNKGYWFYTTARIPADKNPLAVDEKLIDRYGLELSKWARARRRRQGWASVAYLRHGRFFVLIATQGKHPLFQFEGAIRDIRREPLLFQGYSIGCGKGSDGRYHSSVKIHGDAFNELLAWFLTMACRRSEEELATAFRAIRFIPFARVRRQLLRLLREVNEARQQTGHAPIPVSVLNLRRRIYAVFADMPGDEPTKGTLSAETADGQVVEPLPVA